MKGFTRVISKKGKFRFEFEQAIKNANGRCQAFPKWAAWPTPVRCLAEATEVLDEVSAEGASRVPAHKYIAVCEACRIAGMGSTPAERGARTRAAKAAQKGLFE